MTFIKSTFLLATFILFSSVSVTETEPPVKNGDGKIEWVTFEEAVKLNSKKKNKKKVFIDVYTDWCGWCKRMDQTTFSDPTIAEYMNATYYAVKFDGEQKEPLIFNGKEYKFIASGRRGYHELAAHLLQGRLAYPTTVILDENFEMLQVMPGYQKPPQLDQKLKYYGGNHNATKEFSEFLQNYQSPFDGGY